MSWGRPLSPFKIARSRVGYVRPSNTCFLQSIEDHIPNGISTGTAVIAQLVLELPSTLQRGRSFPQKCPLARGSGPPSNTWFLGFT